MKKEIANNENLKRRKFLKVLGMGTAGIAAGKILASRKDDKTGKSENKTLQVTVHPNAVKRNQKGNA